MHFKLAASFILASSLLLSGHARPTNRNPGLPFHRRALNGTCATSTSLPPSSTEVPTSTIAAPVPAETVPPLPQFPATFNNPIKPGAGADPWVIYSKEQDTYYLIQSADGGLTVHASRDLTQFAEHGTKVWSPPDGLSALWAPELHYINGDWYIYVAMQTTGDNASHRMYVLKGTSQDPTQAFDLVGKVSTSDDNWAIDGTVLQYEPNGKLYFIWSGWTDPGNVKNQNLYIAEMSSPTQISSDRVLLHEPTAGWQRSGDSGVNEGPEVLVNNGRTFLVYSAAGSWTDDYCLALMGIDGGADPMDAGKWWRLDDRPVMWSSDTALAPGHASFTTARDGTPYVVYHAVDHPGGGWDGRTIRTQSFGWNPDSSPAYPMPVGFDVALPHPQ